MHAPKQLPWGALVADFVICTTDFADVCNGSDLRTGFSERSSSIMNRWECSTFKNFYSFSSNESMEFLLQVAPQCVGLQFICCFGFIQLYALKDWIACVALVQCSSIVLLGNFSRQRSQNHRFSCLFRCVTPIHFWAIIRSFRDPVFDEVGVGVHSRQHPTRGDSRRRRSKDSIRMKITKKAIRVRTGGAA